MLKNRTFRLALGLVLLFQAAAMSPVAGDKILVGQKQKVRETPGDNRVLYPCLTPRTAERILTRLERDKPWSLPKRALAPDFYDTLNILVLRFNFQYEDPDDPSTTGRGRMNLSHDTAAFRDSAGHFIDPPPHDSLYFDAHMRALRTYWETTSEGKITLAWDIYPPARDSVYELPNPMSHYGRCEWGSVVPGLEHYLVHCIQLVDTLSPEISFSDYESVFLFHAGSDRQNDIGFPETCSDLFSGFIRMGDSIVVDDSILFVDGIPVDNGADTVREALIVPETSSQDNRATALNAVIAHEFGHQLGLVDLYSTATFMSQLGDFALMDNNGFGTGIDFGFEVGRVFGAIPLFPMAWSRAYLGYVEVVDYRQGSDIRLVAAEVVSSGIKVARVPISENEYYLIENRIIDIDGQEAAARVDSATNVILGPVNLNMEFNREYDFLMPGSGVLIYHVDERVAGLDYDYDGLNNFEDNDLQWAFDIFGNPVDKFIALVEADGFVNFGGYYRSGWGSEDDMFRDDRNDSLTPNSNPAAIDNSGNNTRVHITRIRRAPDTTSDKMALMDSVVLFDVRTDRLAGGFPVRGGQPAYGLSPIVDDLDGDGRDEIIFASGELLSVVALDGKNFLREYTQCAICPLYYDTARASVHPGAAHAVPLYVRTDSDILAGPVTGWFPDGPDANKLVAVGRRTGIGSGQVEIYRLFDGDNDGEADISGPVGQGFFGTAGAPIALSFGDTLYALTDSGYVYRKTAFQNPPTVIFRVETSELHGICRIGDGLIVMAGDAASTSLYYGDGADSASISLDDHYTLGPVLADLNLDGVPELVACTRSGRIVLVSVDVSVGGSAFAVLDDRATGFPFTANPIAGDVDLDGYPDIILGGTNRLYAFNYQLIMKTSFPVEISDRFLNDDVIAAPVMADIEDGGAPEVVFPTAVGNIYSFGLERSCGFPISAGEIGAGSPVICADSSSGKLGYLGADGWFYLWDVDADTANNFWPMGGADPSGTFSFDHTKLPSPRQYSDLFPKERFYNYPNPVVNGETTIRYFLGETASSVEVAIFSLSGRLVAQFIGPTTGGVDNELTWGCGNVVPGVYRCVVNADFGGRTETAFTDIAIIR